MPIPGGLPIKNLGQLAQALTTRLQQLYQPPPTSITGVSSNNWPSALQPVRPIGNKGAEPLVVNYMMGQNLAYTPRADMEFSAAMLKALACYPLARICIENVKDQICRIPYIIQLKTQSGESKGDHKKRTQEDTLGLQLNTFFEYPDGEHNWSEWLRPVLDDMLVIDAASILVRRTKAGRIMQLVNIPGESITRYIDDNGMTPPPPSPAYAQLWEGIPRVDLTTDQLIYKPRNIVRRNSYASQLYGMGPTEQSAIEIQVGAARLAYVLAFYADGGIPNALQVLPATANATKIKESMAWMSSELSGNLQKRRHLFQVQGFTDEGTDQVLFPKEPVLADAFDDLHIRKICFAYGTSPQRLMRMMNRASAGAAQEASEEEGLMPWVDWVKGVIDHIIQRKAGYSNYEIVFNPYQELDIVKQSVAQKNLVSGGIRTPNEAREAIGDDPSSTTGANDLGITTGTGRVPIEAVAAPLPAPPGSPSGSGAPKEPGKGPGAPASGPKKLPAGKMAAEMAYDLLKYKHGVVMVTIPSYSELGQKILSMQGRIDPEHLREKGLEKELHVTVRHGFSGDDSAIQSYLATQPPVKLTLGKTFAFEATEHSDGAAPVCIKVESDDLTRMNAELEQHGTWKPADFDYHPHVTLAYIDPNETPNYVNWDDVDGEELELESAVISRGDSNLEKFNPNHDDKGEFSSGGGGSRPKGKGQDQVTRTGKKFETNSGRKTEMLKVEPGRNINTDVLHSSIFNDDEGMVRVVWNANDGSLNFPNAGMQDADHGNFSADVTPGQNPDLHQVRGTMDLSNAKILWYDLRSESQTISQDSGATPQRVEGTIKTLLWAANASTFYVNGKKMKYDTAPISEILGSK